MDGPFYIDTRGPHNYASGSTITLTNAYQALLPVGAYPVLGQNYFSYVGKAVRIRAFGQFTTGATPGNITLQYLWGTGASNNGTGVGGVAVIGVANLTNNSWFYDMLFRCRSVGPTGSLFGSGFLEMQGIGVVASPASAPAAATIDTTQNFVLSLQSQRSGSTAETIQIHDILFEAMN